MMKPRSSLLHQRGVTLARRLARIVLGRRRGDERMDRRSMEDQELVRRALYSVLRDCKMAQRAGVGGAPGSQQVIHIGDAPVTININGDMHFHAQECPKPQ